MTLIKNKIKTVVFKKASDIFLKEAEKSVNTSCSWWTYQPKLPDQVKRLRKF